MHIALLGRQGKLGLAELECLYGSAAITPIGEMAALVETDSLDIQALGGIPKAGRVVAEINGDWKRVSRGIEQYYADAWKAADHKITLGISAYGPNAPAPRQLQTLGLALKKARKHHPGSLRLIPNEDSGLSTATSHHNKLGLSPNKIELLIITAPSGITYLAESIGAQNITALAARDQARPRTDAFVGMLPPKLALMIVNMTTPHRKGRLLDPFCGTGVILQEAALRGLTPYGSDLSEKMVDYSTQNLAWLADKQRLDSDDWQIDQADATKHIWQPPVDLVVCETYLGQPFSAPPSPAKLREVRGNCNHIISSFLTNIHPQLQAGTALTLAVPAWRGTDGRFTHLPLTHELEELGYRRRTLQHARVSDLLYYRENQVVARELLLLRRD